MSSGTFVLYQEEPRRLQPAPLNENTNPQAEGTKYSKEELSSALLQLLGITLLPSKTAVLWGVVRLSSGVLAQLCKALSANTTGRGGGGRKKTNVLVIGVVRVFASW